MRYARGTTISPQRTMEEISKLLKKEGVNRVIWIDGDDRIGAEFVLKDRRLRFLCVLPDRNETALDRNSRQMGKTQAYQAHERMIRERWRGLLLVIKAKLESIAVGCETLEEAFMAQLVMADNKTLGEVVLPQIASGQLLLPPGGK